MTHAPTRNPLVRFQRGFERRFERFAGYQRTADRRWLAAASCSSRCFLLCCVAAFALVPWLGQDFFPNTDSGQFILHMRAKTGTRIEETARLAIWSRPTSAGSFRRAIWTPSSTISACPTAAST